MRTGARRIVNVMLYVAGGIAALLFVGWLGLQVQPAPFPEYAGKPSLEASTVALPAGLPAPVDTYYRKVYGDRVPVVSSVVITGRGRISPMGVWFPARFRFTHDAGKGYRHYIEATWFGIPFLKVNERYLDGRSLCELPFATTQGPKVEQAANLGMWAELAGAAPSVLVTDPRVRWEPVDAETAILVVPLGGTGTDRFVVRFDPDTDDWATMEAMRYRDQDSPKKILWIAASQPGATVGPHALPAVGTATWLDMGAPWAQFGTERIDYGVDVRDYIRARGI
jgi:hypothetical protein